MIVQLEVEKTGPDTITCSGWMTFKEHICIRSAWKRMQKQIRLFSGVLCGFKKDPGSDQGKAHAFQKEESQMGLQPTVASCAQSLESR